MSISLPVHASELLVRRIISGVLYYNTLEIRQPTPEILYASQRLYNQVYENAVFEGVLKDGELIVLLKNINYWNDTEEELIKAIPKHIEYFQKEMFVNFDNEAQFSSLQLHIDKARSELEKLFNKRNNYSHLTAEGVAGFAKIQYIIEQCTFENDYNCNWDKHDIKDAITYYHNNYISDDTLRYLSRNYPWADIWYASGKSKNPFGKPSTHLSDDQRKLTCWSMLYDNIRDYPDCPRKEIIACDDALDGWLIVKRDEREKESNESEVKRKAGSNANAQEVFIVAGSRAEADRIYSVNSPMSRAAVKHRLDVIDKLGEAQDTNFGDVQRELSMLQTRAENDKRRV